LENRGDIIDGEQVAELVSTLLNGQFVRLAFDLLGRIEHEDLAGKVRLEQGGFPVAIMCWP
jgi:hypothetical protein